MTTAASSSAAACSHAIISCSASVWRATTFSPSRPPTPSQSATKSAYVVRPYTSGSRVPRRPRFGPFSTYTVVTYATLGHRDRHPGGRDNSVGRRTYRRSMTTFVLVPGAWLGAWAWHDVAELLTKAGHDVHPVTLTGLAERAAEADPSTDLDTHIEDVTRVLDENDMHDVVLVGHSYGGAPVTGAADRRPDRVAAVVFVDSGPVPDGVAIADFNPPEESAETDAQVATSGDGWLVPPIAFEPADDPVTLAGLDAAALRTLREHATPHPYASMTQPIRLTGAGDAIPRTLIACTMPLDVVRGLIDAGNPFFVGLADATLLALPTGHWPMFSEADALAEMLATTHT